jgi:hypothetical protein
MTCYDCIHCDVCSGIGACSYHRSDVSKCKYFKNKADFVEVVRCKNCAGAIKHKEYPNMYKCNGCNPVRGRLVSSNFGCVCGVPRERKDV